MKPAPSSASRRDRQSAPAPDKTGAAGAIAAPAVLQCVEMALADVSIQNLVESLAQFCDRLDVGSLPVLSWTV